MDDLSAFSEMSNIRSTINELFQGKISWSGKKKRLTDQYLTQCIIHVLDSPVISYVHAAFENTVTRDYFDVTPEELIIYRDEEEVGNCSSLV